MKVLDIQKTLKDLKRDEGFIGKPYRDTRGFLTIGYGRNLDAKGIDEEEADFLLREDLNEVLCRLDKLKPSWRNHPEKVQRAIVNMGFNMGVTGLLKFSKMWGYLDAGDYLNASAEALDSRWAKQVGARAYRIAELIGAKET